MCLLKASFEGNESGIDSNLWEFKPLSFREFVSQRSNDNAYAKGMAQLGICPSKARIM
jgi:hypothetical protein